MPKHTLLFLNENPLPPVFTRSTISGKELRLRAALSQIDEIHVICRRGGYMGTFTDLTTLLEKKIIIHRLPSWPYYLSSLPLFCVGLWWTLRLKPLTIEAESPILSGPAAVIIGWLTRTPVIVEVRASYDHLIAFRLNFIPRSVKQYLLDRVVRFTYRHAARIIANSRTYQRQIRQLGYKAVVINPGLQYFPFASTSKSFPGNKPVIIGYIGRLVPEKGVDLLLQAIALLVRTPLSFPVKFEIAGTGPECHHLQHQAHNLQLDPYLTFLGEVRNTRVFKRWHLLINPCLVNHPLEMVNAEAAASAVPVICFGQRDCPETVKHQVTGIKILPKTPEALSQAIADLLIHPQVYQQFSAAAPSFAQKHYAFGIQVNHLRRLYRSLFPSF